MQHERLRHVLLARKKVGFKKVEYVMLWSEHRHELQRSIITSYLHCCDVERVMLLSTLMNTVAVTTCATRPAGGRVACCAKESPSIEMVQDTV